MATNEKWQWQMWVTVIHGPAVGHRLELGVNSPRWAAPQIYPLGSWRGMGVPSSVLKGASARIAAVLEEHLVTRYGEKGELPTMWAGEVDPS